MTPFTPSTDMYEATDQMFQDTMEWVGDNWFSMVMAAAFPANQNKDPKWIEDCDFNYEQYWREHDRSKD